MINPIISLIREYDRIGPISGVSVTQSSSSSNLTVTICRAGGAIERPSSGNPDVTIKGWTHHPDIVRIIDCEYYPQELDIIVLAAANYSHAYDVLQIQDGFKNRYHYKPHNLSRAGEIPRAAIMVRG